MAAESFCWWGVADGVYIPAFLLRYRGISPSAKMCFARLIKFCGQNETCYPSQETIAEELGVSLRSIGGYLQELEEDGFIEIIRQGLQKPNLYRPLRHKLLKATFCGSASDLDRQDVADQDQQDVADPSIRLKKSIEVNQTTTQTGSTPPSERTFFDTRIAIESQLGRVLKNSELSALQKRSDYPEESNALAWAKTENLIDEDKPSKWPKQESKRPSKPIYQNSYPRESRFTPSVSVVIVDKTLDAYLEIAKIAGKAIGDKEREDAAPIWVTLTDEQKAASARDYARIAKENAGRPKYVPLPASHLSQKPWTRTTAEFVFAAPESKEEAYKRVRDRRKANYEAGLPPFANIV